MHITGLRLASFRLFDDVEFQFAPGLNVVRGPNESGKSTVVRALVAALFEGPQADNVQTRSDYRWGAEEKPVLEIEFEDRGHRYRLIKDFRHRKVALQELEGPDCLTTTKAVEARIAGLIGFSDPAQFLRTACVTHDQMVSISGDSSGGRKLAGLLREVVVGDRESASMESAIKALSGEIDELKRGLERPAKNPGTIARLQEERESLISREKELKEGISDLESGKSRLSEVQRLLEDKEQRLKELEELLDKNGRSIELERRAKESRRKFSSADKVKDAGREFERTEARIERSFHGFLDLDPDVDAELKKEIELRESLGVLARELEGERSQEEAEPGRSGRRWVGWVGVALGAALVALGAALGTVHPALFSLLAPGILMLVAGAYLLVRARARAPAATAGMMDERISRADKEIEKMSARENEFLISVGCEDAATFFARFESYRELAGERDRIAAGFEALMWDRTMEEVEEERREASLEVSACDSELAELRPFRLSRERLEETAGEQGELAGEVEALRKEREGLGFHLGKTSADPEEALQLEEDLAWLWEAEQRARRRLRVYTMAGEAMRDTAERLVSSAVPALAEGVGRTFKVLTGGRYNTVEVRESDLAMSVYSSEKGEMIPVGELLSSLSKGTLSQLYLAARLQLVDMLSGGRRPPLIFDDSFSYFDEDRLRLLWDVLVEVARDQQVFLLTCCDRYDDLIGPGVNVIDLEPPPVE